MSGSVRTLIFALLAVFWTTAAPQTAVIESKYASEDIQLQLDPEAAFWKASAPVYMENDTFGKAVPGYRTEVRTRWTKTNLYLLFICPYEQLHLKPEPNTRQETNELWNWDVAEVFVGSDFKDIQRYKEFEISPQGEWVDLDIDLHKPHHEDGWTWNSGFQALAKIDSQRHIWYGAMRIPFSAIDPQSPAAGTTLRINLFRSQGPPGHPHSITWQAPMTKTFHTPERFGLLKLIEG